MEIRTETALVRVEKGRALVTCQGGQREIARFDSVVVAAGNHSFDPLSAELQQRGYAVSVIGDARTPGSIHDAVKAGYRAALAI